MKKFMSKMAVVVLLIQISAGPIFAQNNMRQFSRPLDDSMGQASGMSFRKTDMRERTNDQKIDVVGDSMGTKGMMMTEPSIAGLTYQVHVLGEVKNPGTYKIMASDRLSEVLQTAGGLGDQGSKRNIEVRRKGEGTKHLDLLAFQMKGELEDNPYLLDNDVVFVPLHGAMVQIVGAVMRPGEYELRAERTLADVLGLAGGFSIGAAKDSPLRVVRFVDDKKEVVEVAAIGGEMSKFVVQNGDVIFVPNVITEKNNFDYDIPKLPGDNIFYPSYEDRVFVLGGVASPGAYLFNPYYKLSQYLSLAGGTTQLATSKITLTTPYGKKYVLKGKVRDDVVINPGDTILVAHRRIPPEGWVSLVMGFASFGLSTTATVLALTNR